MRKEADFPALLQSFFTTRLMTQRRVSPHTIASYRDTFRLLLQFAQKKVHKTPSQLSMEDLDASLIGAFLDDLQTRRGNGPRSRNLRLTAVRSFFRYAALEAPGHAALIQRVLAIPNQRQPRAMVDFLTRPEIDALLAVPNRETWLGRRDHAFLLTAVQTGLRLSEMTSLRHEDVSLGAGAHVHCHGKGRKERCTPLAKPTVAALKAWIREQGREDSKTLFPSARGGRLSAVGVQHMVARHVAVAGAICPTLRKKRVSPHVLRHAAAMELLQAGVDRAVIALWLGHESVETTQIYLDADLALKEQVLAKTKPLKSKAGRYRPDDALLAYLKTL
ncbi:MAG: site-specific integrase [Bryobacteraceae bacterium]